MSIPAAMTARAGSAASSSRAEAGGAVPAGLGLTAPA
jgi:hypothetical protein